MIRMIFLAAILCAAAGAAGARSPAPVPGANRLPVLDSACTGRGIRNSDGICICRPGFFGAACEKNTMAVCSGRGNPNRNGECACEPGYTGKFCEAAPEPAPPAPPAVPSGRPAPPTARVDVPPHCSGRGVLTTAGQCTCNLGFSGAHCENFSAPASNACSGHGTSNIAGTCTCSFGYGGPRCDQCAPKFFNYPTCKYADAATTCSGRGSVGADGQCLCNAGYMGPNCLNAAPSQLTSCNGRGVAIAPGQCTCNPGYTGSDCSIGVLQRR